jgi:PAS domain S-box-containing protein
MSTLSQLEQPDRAGSDGISTADTALEAQRLRHIVDSMPAYLAYVDSDLRYAMANRTYEEWFGKKAEEIIGRRVVDVLGPSYENVRAHLEGALAGVEQRFETRMGTVEGERILGVIHLPDYDEDGVIRGVIVHGHDITWRKKQEATLLQQEKLAAVGRLASSIAHEINNPLESVVNLLYLIEQSSDPATVEFARTAQGELARVSQIATETLRFFKQSTNATPARPDQLISSVLALYQGRLMNSGIQVSTQSRGQADGVWFESEMRQVLNNLVANAIDAMRGTGFSSMPGEDGTTFRRSHLTLRSSIRTDHPTGRKTVRILVADTGPGMDAAIRARIFEPFFTTKGIMGTGLGLWVSSELVAKNSGRLRARSSQDAAHRGTVFLLDIPLG